MDGNFVFKKTDQIGHLDAETDTFLGDCFYETEVYDKLINFNDSIDSVRRIIVGRTGSGKTALLKIMQDDTRIKKYDVIEAEYTVFEHINNNVFISSLINDGVSLRVFYKSLWLHVLLTNVINLLYQNKSSFFEKILNTPFKKKINIELAKDYVSSFKDSFFNDNIITEITKKMQSDLSSSIEIKGLGKVGAKLKQDDTEKLQSATTKYVSSELLRKQKELIKLITSESSDERQMRIIISIDDLDKSWLSSSEIRYEFIDALLEAFKEILNINSVKVLISIRTDILMGIYKNTLRQKEKDKSLIMSLSWNKSEIRKILDLRISYLIKNKYSKDNVLFTDIFNFDIDGKKACDYIIDKTMLRPRDAIDFVNLCFSETDGSTKLTEDIVISAEEKFFSSRKEALITEWVSIYPFVSDYLDSICFIESNTFKVSTLNQIVKNEISTFIVDKTPNDLSDDEHDLRALKFEELINIWFICGVVGIKKTENVIIYSSFEKLRLDITDLRKEFIIHPLFFRY
jgi:hypothetical protein